MSDLNMRQVKTGEYNTFLLESGDPSSPTIIFLHGSGPGVTAKTNWEDVLPHYKDQFYAVAPDIYGFGDTDHPEEPPTSGAIWMRERINQVLNLMDALGKEKVHLVGNSLGGVISLHLLMYAPERFERVVLMGTGAGLQSASPELAKLMNFHRDPHPVALKNLLRWFVYDEDVLEGKLDQIVEERIMNFNRPDVRRSYEATFINANLADIYVPPSALKRMNHPMLLIHGHQDRVVPLDSSLYMMEHLPDAQLHIFKRCGHWAQIEQKDRFVKLTLDFFNKVI